LNSVVSFFANFLGPYTNFFDIKSKQQITAFLDTRIRNTEIDPDRRWITTWNDYLWRIKYFLRWLRNHKDKAQKGIEPLQQSYWITPSFVNIKKKKTRRISPYLESELWERDEILSIIKYEPHLTFLWDLNARPHEALVTSHFLLFSWICLISYIFYYMKPCPRADITSVTCSGSIELNK
jgi:integrase/recombinase XerD